MTENLEHNVPDRHAEHSRQFRKKNGLVFIACFALATVFWIINDFTLIHDDEVRVPVVYRNLPAGKLVVNKLPKKLTLGISATGWKLLNAHVRTDWHVEIDVNRRAANNMYSTNADPDYFTKQLPEGYKVKYVKPGVLYFEFDEIVSRKVPVQLVKKIRFRPHYELSGKPVLEPDSVVVSGPGRIVDTLNAVLTAPVTADKVTDTLSGTVALRLPGDYSLSIDINEVHYILPVEQFTESSLDIPVTILNPGNHPVTLIPENVRVIFRLPVSRYNLVKSGAAGKLFELQVTIPEQNPGGNMIPVKITRNPSWAEDIRLQPEFVTFYFTH